MANYVVVDKDQLEADLTTVADAIRSKGGTTGSLAFPNGMKSAVESIQAGGSGGGDGGGNSLDLPSGYAMETGVVIPASNTSSTIYVQTKNKYNWGISGSAFALVFSLEDVEPSPFIGFRALTHFQSTASRGHYRGYGNTLTTSSSVSAFFDEAPSDALGLRTVSNAPFAAGKRYLWVVVGEVV